MGTPSVLLRSFVFVQTIVGRSADVLEPPERAAL
jgi:hypothetical protein